MVNVNQPVFGPGEVKDLFYVFGEFGNIKH